MMMIAGAVLLVMGLASGLLLLVAPFAVGHYAPSFLTWAMFPALTLGGYLFVALGARAGAIVPVSRIAGGVLLAFALAAVVALFLIANSAVGSAGGTLSLWYVLVIGIVLGPIGLWFRRRAEDTL
jgi:hypothetical protein